MIDNIAAHYGVPAEVGRMVMFENQPARITRAATEGMYLVVRYLDRDGQPIGDEELLHPTWHVDYLDGMGVRGT